MKTTNCILLAGVIAILGLLSIHIYNMDYANYTHINEGLRSTLEQCKADGTDNCHIEYIYDRDGTLLYGEVVGQEIKGR